MHVTTLRLENFARYEDQELTFHPGFNTIIGSSDSGKSSILRALVWVLYNRPSGTEMCREGSEETRVTLRTSEGVLVSRIRSKKRNAYELTDASGTLVFDAVKTDVPLEVSSALGVSFAELGKNLEMLGVSRQMDGPFLLGSSGSDAAKILGNLSGVTTLDRGLGTLRPDLAATKRDLDALEKIERTYAATIPEYANLPNEERSLARVAMEISFAQKAQTRLALLSDLQKRMNSYNAVIEGADARIVELDAALAAGSYLIGGEASLGKHHRLLTLLTAMNDYRTKSNQIEKDLKAATLALAALQDKYTDTLRAAGSCPLCGARQ